MSHSCLYSIEQIRQDILDFEGIQVKLKFEFMAVAKRLYSEYHKQSLGDDNTVDAFKLRFQKYTKENIVPVCDIDPSELEMFGVYAVTDRAKPAVLIGRFNEIDYTQFTTEHLPAETMAWFLIDKDYNVLQYFVPSSVN